jgi:hypothetical protein
METNKWNPVGEILFPDENNRRHKQLKIDLADFEALECSWSGELYTAPPYLCLFVVGINETQAMQLAVKHDPEGIKNSKQKSYAGQIF